MTKIEKMENLGFRFHPFSSNELKIIVPNLNYKIEIDGSVINKITYKYVEINLGDRYVVNIGNENKISYKINNISIDNSNKKIISVKETLYGNYNTTSIFMLPLMFKSRAECSYIEYKSDKYRGYLINSFIDSDFIKKECNFSILLLLKFSKFTLFKATEEYFRNFELTVECFDVSKDYVVYEIAVPAKFSNDYQLILNGQYSKISEIAKNRIISFHGKSVEGTIATNVLNKDPEYKSYLENIYDVDMTNVDLWKKMDQEDILLKKLL